MASTQAGTGSLTVAGQAALAATYITVPASSIIESVSVNNGGSPIFEDVYDEDGALHTRITFEKGMHTATVVVVGVAYATGAGEVDGSSSNYYITGVSQEHTKGAIRTTVNVERIPTIA